MDIIEKECKLQYKEDFDSWMENQRKELKFSKKNLDLVNLIASQAAKDDDSFRPYIIENVIGSLYYTVDIQELELFTFTDQINNTVTTFRLSLENSNLEGLYFADEEVGENARKPEVDSCETCDLFKTYKPEYVRKVISGSMRGSEFLAYTNNGRIILIDWNANEGRIVGKWPVDPGLNTGCYDLVPYDPFIQGAISGDGSFVAVIGPPARSDNHSYVEITLFYIGTQESCTKKLFIDDPNKPGNTIVINNVDIDIASMVINPFHQNLFYLMVSYDFGYKILLIVYDHIEETVLSNRKDVVMSVPFSHEYYYDTTDGPVFIHHGNIMIAYHEAVNEEDERMYNYILFLDAFNLDIVATVTLSSIDIVLKQFFVVSTCQTEIAIFIKEDGVEKVEVYKIPDQDISLQNLCRRQIVRNVNGRKVDELTMLPSKLRNYLKL